MRRRTATPSIALHQHDPEPANRRPVQGMRSAGKRPWRMPRQTMRLRNWRQMSEVMRKLHKRDFWVKVDERLLG